MVGQELLLLDNDERIVELLSWYLGERGYSVRAVNSFADARNAIAERRPDLLVSDVDLGMESALVELPKLSAEGKLPPTLVVSGYLDLEVRHKLDAVPEVLGTVAKPFEFPDLEASIESCLAGLQAPQEAPREAHGDAPVGGASPHAAQTLTPTPPPASDAADAETEDDDGWIEITPGA